nr:unnamed protein product [Callosobruchus analis]
MGDFNAPLHGSAQAVTDHKCNIISNCLNINKLIQYNEVKNPIGRLLDLVLSNITCSVLEDDVPLSKVDEYHPPLMLTVDCNIPHYDQFKVSKSSPKTFNFRRSTVVILLSKPVKFLIVF